jgi:hypothetical protein
MMMAIAVGPSVPATVTPARQFGKRPPRRAGNPTMLRYGQTLD